MPHDREPYSLQLAVLSTAAFLAIAVVSKAVVAWAQVKIYVPSLNPSELVVLSQIVFAPEILLGIFSGFLLVALHRPRSHVLRSLAGWVATAGAIGATFYQLAALLYWEMFFTYPTRSAVLAATDWHVLLGSASGLAMKPTFAAVAGLALVSHLYALLYARHWPGPGKRARLHLCLALVAAVAFLVTGRARIPLPAAVTSHPLLGLLDPNSGSLPHYELPEPADHTGTKPDGVLCGYPRAQSPERAAKSKAPPDVIVVFWESAAAWAVGPHSEPARTPCLSAIPGELTVFDNIRCNAPYTVTSLATFLMGAYAPLVIHNWGVHERPYFLPRVFAGSGFETWSVSCSNMQFSGTRQMMKAFGFDRVVSGEDAPARYDRNLWGVDDRFVFDQLKERLSRPSDRPLFAVALTSSTHYPYQDPLPGFPRIIADPLGRYEQAIAFTDQQIVAFYQFLKGRRGARDFVFLVVGDHGQAFGQHAGAVGHGGALFEENIRVACVMLHPPGELPRRISTTGSILDLGPTVIELAGLPSRPEHQGRSLLGAAPPNVAISYLPVYDVKFSICFDNYKLIADPRTQLYNLYDLRKDPRERVDVSARERARAECLLAYLSRWLKGQEARWRELVTGAE